jgi:VanZ family protein
LKQFLKYNLWGILWGLFIVILTVLPGKVFPLLPTFLDIFHPDKLIHIFIFAVFFFLQARGFLIQDSYPSVRKHAILIALILGFSIGAATEVIQEYFVPMRAGDPYDFIADMLGSLAGLGIFGIWRRRHIIS